MKYIFKVVDIDLIKHQSGRLTNNVHTLDTSTGKTYTVETNYISNYKSLLGKEVSTDINDSIVQFDISSIIEQDYSCCQLKCPICQSNLIKIDKFSNTDYYCFNISCHQLSTLSIIDLFDSINLYITYDEAMYIFNLFNNIFIPRVNLISIMNELENKTTIDNMAKTIYTRIEQFICDCNIDKFLKMIKIPYSQTLILKLDILCEERLELFIEKIMTEVPYDKALSDYDRNLLELVRIAIVTNSTYIKGFLDMRKVLHSKYLGIYIT